MNLKNTLSIVSIFSLLILPWSGVNANPDAPGMMHCEKMHGGPGMGPMMQGPMAGGDDSRGMPPRGMQHRRHHQMMQQRMGQRGPGMMKRRMMQQRMQHMQRMEDRLARIESLLEEMVELQKQGQPSAE